jgi:hypothetical protein
MRNPSLPPSILLAIVVAGAGCSHHRAAPAASALAFAPGCEPLLDGSACSAPYPSNFFRRVDAAGVARVVMEEASVPRTTDGVTDADAVTPLHVDGFSRNATLVGALPGDLDPATLCRLDIDAARSVAGGCSTTLLDADTGERVAHYADVAPRADGSHDAVILRAYAPLLPTRRYVVAFAGVGASGGGVAPSGAGFARLRDRAPGPPAVDAERDRFERDVFPVLTRAGIARGDLQLAWDFTTTSAESPRHDMLRVRELTRAWLASQRPVVVIDAVDEAPAKGVLRVVHGSFQAPSVLDGEGPTATLARDAAGEVVVTGRVNVPFEALVPASAIDRVGPLRALGYGHGFFNARTEITDAQPVTIANTLAAVLFAVDWWGMSRDDVDTLATRLAKDPKRTVDFVDRLHQAMVNWMVLTAAVRTAMAELPPFRRPTAGAGAGSPLYDAGRVDFLGCSQGHILGGTLAALDPELRRVVLDVGGAGFTHMMPRARPFGVMSALLANTVGDRLTTEVVKAMFQSRLDEVDPATYAPLLLDGSLPGSPADRQVLLQMGLGDAEVPNAASYFHARALGIGVTAQPGSPLFGIAEAPADAKSALTVFDFGVRAGVEPAPPPDNAVHLGVRVARAALAQMDALFREDGRILRDCAGACPGAP